MRKLLVTTAIATMAFAGAASAQSLLERVLSELPTPGDVTGIFANTADNLAGTPANAVTIGGSSEITTRTLAAGDVITLLSLTEPTDVTGTVGADGSITRSDGSLVDGVTLTIGAPLLTDGAGRLTVADGAVVGASGAVGTAARPFTPATVTNNVGAAVFSSTGINASVTNILRGLTGPTAMTERGASATEAVDALIGNIATTALGAVNTGDIQLIGSNLSFSEEIDTATAGTSSAVQQTIQNAVTQVGTTTGATVLALNSALNEANVNASVSNVMNGVNTTIGRSGFELAFAGADADFSSISGLDAAAIAALTGGISTTGLGAVNTGTIISGAQNQVNGVISSIVGTNSATSAAGVGSAATGS